MAAEQQSDYNVFLSHASADKAAVRELARRLRAHQTGPKAAIVDALELRELRLKMKQKGEAREPVDGALIRPGWVRELTRPPGGTARRAGLGHRRGDRPAVAARDRQWRGKTEEVIKNYFTQIGKCYYRSP
ncbi:MAG: hypothetical protein O3C40_28085 [Planctomycetota bacterium]|nr:hypothetical protein [Planctomycetota bacterium]